MINENAAIYSALCCFEKGGDVAVFEEGLILSLHRSSRETVTMTVARFHELIDSDKIKNLAALTKAKEKKSKIARAIGKTGAEVN